MDLIAELAGGTFLIQMSIVLALMFTLHFLLFKPYLRVFDERRRRTGLKDDSVQKLDLQGREISADIERRLGQTWEEVSAARKKLIDVARGEEQELLKKARDDMQREIEKAKSALAQDFNAAQEKLERDARSWARDLASRVLGREIAPGN